jgi:hypothetical protein
MVECKHRTVDACVVSQGNYAETGDLSKAQLSEATIRRLCVVTWRITQDG